MVMPDASTARAFNEPTLPRHTQLGQYEVLDRLAVGGMAELYMARRVGIEGFEKRVVLKRVLPQHAGDQAFADMFLNEARLAARLDHPNVVQVMDIGVIDDEFFFVMEYLHGKNLRDVLNEAAKASLLPLEFVVNVAIGMAAGLHHAHECVGPDGRLLGLVHRDVAPSNVIITYEGSVKMVDFGIAKAAAVASSTATGSIKGKVGYMAPEAFQGLPVDRRSDVFSLGVVLYEMTTGQRPFVGENQFAILNAAVEGRYVLPSEIVPEYPAELEAVVVKALASERADRFATAEALQSALEEFAAASGVRVGPSTTRDFMRASFEVPDLLSAPPTPDVEAAARSLSSYRVGRTERAVDTAVDPARSARTRPLLGAGIALAVTLAGGIGLGAWLVRSGAAEKADPAAGSGPESVPSSTPAAKPAEPTEASPAAVASDREMDEAAGAAPPRDADGHARADPEPDAPHAQPQGSRSKKKSSRKRSPQPAIAPKPESSLFPPSHYE